MLEPKQEFHFNPFVGVRFVLFGFDCLKHDEVRSKLVREGGVDVGQYGLDCTHVIVDKLVYDDPICIAARSDGKILVASLWVDHSLDVGIPVDTSPIMYKPVKDLNGIPGAKHLIICLTGYQRQDRDDIMTMVSLMRAQFSKPLVANKVTHLICYKFEGEKYELAKRLKKIKLVNHRWLQDCLKAWEILPEENYSKSGYELEMEAEAQDSEEETETFDAKLSHGRNTSTSPHNFQNKSPHSVQNNMPGNHDPLIIGGTVANNGPVGLQNLSAHSLQDKILENQDAPIIGVRASNAGPSGLPNIGNTKDLTSIVQEEIKSFQAFESSHFKQMDHPERNYGDSSGVSDHLLNTSATDLPSASGSAKMLAANVDACKLDALTYSRKTPSKSKFTLHSLEDSGNTCTPSKGRLGVDEGRCGFLISSPKVDQVKEKTDSICVEAPLMGTDVDEVGLNSSVPQKRKMDGQVYVSHTRSKPQKLYTSANKKINATDSTTSISGSLGMSKPDSLSHLGGLIIDGSVTTFSAQKTPDNVSTNSYFDKRLLETNHPISRNLVSGAAVSSNSNVSTISITGIDSRNGDQQNQLQNGPTSSPVKDPEVEKPGILKLKSAGGIDTSLSKPVRRKTVAKKTLGSRPKLNTGNAVYRKGSIYLSRTSAQDNVAMHSLTELGAAEHAKDAVNLEGKDAEQSENNVDDHAGPMGDETEAPPELEKAEREKKSKSDLLSSMGGTETGEILGAVELTTVEAGTNAAAARDDAVTTNENEHEKAVYAKQPEPTDSSKDKLAKGKKTNAVKIKIVPTLKDPKMPADLLHDKVAKNGKKKGKEKNKKRVLLLALPSDSSVEVEKENEPAVDNYQKTPKGGDKCVGKLTSKKNSDQKAVNQKRDVSNLIKKEPAWFILSGHRLQRKEFQQVIRRLKGRLCRDSHQWSYQATHFIIPDPIRRTEKFFAAAASGRWILKTDYLTASGQAGRFLPEEPYEWHKNGLTEDGAINLEAPRKWRLMRERTSHGAFYGMRIVIYGECIAPPLDTLKRVVKAGDGTILATSPPYTRFLKSGVDFAIVSPEMPCVDMWVQEFLQHEIPCVVADYLVDYVCKPGYSLERHIQYNTQNWAAKSFASLLSRSKEIVNSPGLGPLLDKEFNDDELPCEVCGCSDRGEVMLICGDESGCHGCGIGTHIDCCDPPLKQVPEEDWFCPKCTTITNPKSKK